MNKLSFACICVFLLLPLLAFARGDADQWLEAEPFVALAPRNVDVVLKSGQRLGKAFNTAVDSASVERLDFFSDTREESVLPLLVEGRGWLLSIPFMYLTPGSKMVAVDFAERIIEWNAMTFSTYLLDQHLNDILRQRLDRKQEEVPARERWIRFAKVLLQVGSKLDPVVTKVIGQPLEIVPGSNLGNAKPGNLVTLRVIFQGQPLVKRSVSAVNRDGTFISEKVLRTDEKGQVQLALSSKGLWIISVIHMVPDDEHKADWLHYVSSMSFFIP